jgi:hypothetical protein
MTLTGQHVQQASERDLAAATTERPKVIEAAQTT